jgi:hypothetical protein
VADAVKPYDFDSNDFTLGLEADYHSILRSRPSQDSDQCSEVGAGDQLKAFPGTYPSDPSDASYPEWYYAELDMGSFKVDGYIAAALVHTV